MQGETKAQHYAKIDSLERFKMGPQVPRLTSAEIAAALMPRAALNHPWPKQEEKDGGR